MKLKTRLIVLNLGVILLIASIIMGSLLVSSYKSIKEKSVETIELTATTVASEMETIIDQAAVDTKAIAKLMGELQKTEAASRSQVNKVLKTYLEENENYIFSWVV